MAGYYPRDLHDDTQEAYFQKPGLPLHDPPTLKPAKLKPGVPKVKPTVAPPNPQNISPKIGIGTLTRLFARHPWFEAIRPTAVEDATIDPGPYYWQESGFEKKPDGMVAPEVEYDAYETWQPPTKDDWKYEFPPLPEVKWQEMRPDIGPAISRSPKIGTVTVNLPDVIIPAPYKLPPDPNIDIWNIPDEVPFPQLWPQPEVITDTRVDVDTVPSKRSRDPRNPPELKETGVIIEFERHPVKPDTQTQHQPITLRFRPYKARASRKRRKDTKAHRNWIKAAHKAVNLTYGTYSEIVDALEALAWNIYVRDSKGVRHLAMPREGGSLLKTVDGLIDGRYELDMKNFILDYAHMQAMDYLQGKFSQGVIKQSVDQGWWTSPQGPQGFVSNQQRAFDSINRDTKVLYEGNT